MKKVFLINGSLLFDAEQRRLSLTKNYPERSVTLHSPASSCLLQLLEHNNEVLSQKYLFENVWEKQGAIVTTNTLYQSIASLRKAMKSLGFTDEIIFTVPKAGFKLVAEIKSGSLADFIIAPVEILPNLPEPEESVSSVESTRNAHFFTSRRAFILAGLLFFLSCGVLWLQFDKHESVFADYYHVGAVNGCQLYSTLFESEKSISLFKALNVRYPIHCKPQDMAFMTRSPVHRGTTILMCDKFPDNNDARCQTFFYRQTQEQAP